MGVNHVKKDTEMDSIRKQRKYLVSVSLECISSIKQQHLLQNYSYLTIIMLDRHINSDFLQLIANLARGVNGTHAVLRAAKELNLEIAKLLFPQKMEEHLVREPPNLLSAAQSCAQVTNIARSS